MFRIRIRTILNLGSRSSFASFDLCENPKKTEFNLFMDGESSSSAQEQRISCELHLEPVANVPEEQAVDCTCYSEAECTG